MDTQVRTSADTLTFLRELEESPYRYDFFMALRRLESMHPDKPRLGEGARPIDEPVRLGQEFVDRAGPGSPARFRRNVESAFHVVFVPWCGIFVFTPGQRQVRYRQTHCRDFPITTANQ